MCLAIPGKVLEIGEPGLMRMGKVDFGGIVREVCLAYLPEVQVGDYVIVHTGFAISRLDEAEAQETLRLLAKVFDTDSDTDTRTLPAVHVSGSSHAD